MSINKYICKIWVVPCNENRGRVWGGGARLFQYLLGFEPSTSFEKTLVCRVPIRFNETKYISICLIVTVRVNFNLTQKLSLITQKFVRSREVIDLFRIFFEIFENISIPVSILFCFLNAESILKRSLSFDFPTCILKMHFSRSYRPLQYHLWNNVVYPSTMADAL